MLINSTTISNNQFVDNVRPLCNCPICSGFNRESANQKPPYAESSDYQINALDSTYRWTDPWTDPTPITLSYSFFTSGSSYYGSETVSEVTTAVKNNVRTILEKVIEPLVNIDFQEVSDSTASYGQMRFMFSNGPGYAYAYYPSPYYPEAGDVHLSPNYQNDPVNSFAGGAGSYGFSALIHEIGHGLGLKHPGNYGSTSPFLPYAEDNDNNTVMTYNSYIGYNSPATLMPYDIKALQYIYGAKAKNSGDTTYSFSSVYGYSAGGETWGSASTPMKLTVFDTSGLDTFNFSSLAFNGSGYRFDLGQNGFITEQSAYNSFNYSPYDNSGAGSFAATKYGTKIAYNTAIENLVNSSSNDQIILNSAANLISGYTANSSTGQDIIESSNNLDKLDLSAFSSQNVSQTQNGNNLVLGLGNQRTITVKDYYLAAANQRINIQFGNSVLPVLSIGNVSVVEGLNTVANFAVNLSAAATNQVTVQYATANAFAAMPGSDYISKSGTLTFNAGETQKIISVSIVNNGINEVNETFKVNLTSPTNATIGQATGVGTISDTQFANVTTILSANVENLTLTGSNNIDGTGNAGTNILTGNSNNNIIKGLNGIDSLYGQGGNDRLTGDKGNDLLVGGTGLDKYNYSTGKAFVATDLGVDTINDLVSTQDKIILSKTTFTAISSNIGIGFSQASEFAKVATDALAATSSADIVYNSANGKLFYNQNGTAAGYGTGAQFAVLTGTPNILATDFQIAA